jgi:hypothetical protein
MTALLPWLAFASSPVTLGILQRLCMERQRLPLPPVTQTEIEDPNPAETAFIACPRDLSSVTLPVMISDWGVMVPAIDMRARRLPSPLLPGTPSPEYQR